MTGAPSRISSTEYGTAQRGAPVHPHMATPTFGTPGHIAEASPRRVPGSAISSASMHPSAPSTQSQPRQHPPTPAVQTLILAVESARNVVLEDLPERTKFIRVENGGVVGRQTQPQDFTTLAPDQHNLVVISRKHFELAVKSGTGGEVWTLTNVSMNPLRVNGVIVSQKESADVTHGSTISFLPRGHDMNSQPFLEFRVLNQFELPRYHFVDNKMVILWGQRGPTPFALRQQHSPGIQPSGLPNPRYAGTDNNGEQVLEEPTDLQRPGEGQMNIHYYEPPERHQPPPQMGLSQSFDESAPSIADSPPVHGLLPRQAVDAPPCFVCVRSSCVNLQRLPLEDLVLPIQATTVGRQHQVNFFETLASDLLCCISRTHFRLARADDGQATDWLVISTSGNPLYVDWDIIQRDGAKRLHHGSCVAFIPPPETGREQFPFLVLQAKLEDEPLPQWNLGAEFKRMMERDHRGSHVRDPDGAPDTPSSPVIAGTGAQVTPNAASTDAARQHLFYGNAGRPSQGISDQVSGCEGEQDPDNSPARPVGAAQARQPRPNSVAPTFTLEVRHAEAMDLSTLDDQDRRLSSNVGATEFILGRSSSLEWFEKLLNLAPSFVPFIAKEHIRLRYNPVESSSTITNLSRFNVYVGKEKLHQNVEIPIHQGQRINFATNGPDGSMQFLRFKLWIQTTPTPKAARGKAQPTQHQDHLQQQPQQHGVHGPLALTGLGVGHLETPRGMVLQPFTPSESAAPRRLSEGTGMPTPLLAGGTPIAALNPVQLSPVQLGEGLLPNIAESLQAAGSPFAVNTVPAASSTAPAPAAPRTGGDYYTPLDTQLDNDEVHAQAHQLHVAVPPSGPTTHLQKPATIYLELNGSAVRSHIGLHERRIVWPPEQTELTVGRRPQLQLHRDCVLDEYQAYVSREHFMLKRTYDPVMNAWKIYLHVLATNAMYVYEPPDTGGDVEMDHGMVDDSQLKQIKKDMDPWLMNHEECIYLFTGQEPIAEWLYWQMFIDLDDRITL